jgi:hypothetical protein
MRVLYSVLLEKVLIKSISMDEKRLKSALYCNKVKKTGDAYSFETPFFVALLFKRAIP